MNITKLSKERIMEWEKYSFTPKDVRIALKELIQLRELAEKLSYALTVAQGHAPCELYADTLKEYYDEYLKEQI